MKTVYFMRHAKSDWTFDLPDIQRPLNSRGTANAPLMGDKLNSIGDNPQLILCSPAVRANTTAKLFAEANHYQGEIIVKQDFYYGNQWDVIDAIKSLNERIDTVMVVGHNPTWENMVSYFVETFRPPKFPTAAVAKVNFNTGSWKKVAPDLADLEWFMKPKDFIE